MEYPTWSRPARALWIEIPASDYITAVAVGSRPARALWIEITKHAIIVILCHVEAREGLVD